MWTILWSSRCARAHICEHVSVIVANQLLDMANKTVEYLMSRNKLLCECRFALLWKKRNGCWNCMTKSHFLCIYSYVSFKWNFQPNKKGTYFYVKRCHKIGFVPHSRNFHIKLLLGHKLNEFYKQCDSLNTIFICEQFRMVQLLKYLTQQWPTILQTDIFTYWPMRFFPFVFHSLSDGF